MKYDHHRERPLKNGEKIKQFKQRQSSYPYHRSICIKDLDNLVLSVFYFFFVFLRGRQVEFREKDRKLEADDDIGDR